MAASQQEVSIFEERILGRHLRHKVTLEQAATQLRREAKTSAERELWNQALTNLLEEQRKVDFIPAAVVDMTAYQGSFWDARPKMAGQWDAYRQQLEALGFPEIDSLDRSSDDILRLMADPAVANQKRKGALRTSGGGEARRVRSGG